MADIFGHSGEGSDNVVAPAPRLQGIFICGIDVTEFKVGFGLITPLGGGSSARQYTQYGVSDVISPQETQLHDLATPSAEGNVFNFEGLIGPQGIPGPPGAPGIIQIIYPPNSNFLTELPHNIDLINDLGTAADRLIYTSAYTATNNFVWTKTDIDAVVKSWNDSGINTDGSFLIIASDAGIYVSIDDGDTWNKYNPDSDSYEQINCESSGGDAVVLGTSGKDRGAILVSSDSGVNWTEKTVTV